jgi:hypothetical protein
MGVYTSNQPLFATRYFAIRSKRGGAGRTGSRPPASDQIAGANNALLGRLRRPPGAWMRPIHQPVRVAPAGYRRLDFAASGLTSLDSAPRERPFRAGSDPSRLTPVLAGQRRGEGSHPVILPGCAGAWTVDPPASRRTGRRHPGSYLRHGAGHRDPHLRGTSITAQRAPGVMINPYT